MVKGIKKTAKILKIFVASILLVLATIPILLSNSSIQNFIAQSITQELSFRLNSKVTLGKIEYKLFNSVLLSELLTILCEVYAIWTVVFLYSA
jgi:hypothetical protein